ncbi:uroplakin-2 [Engraulis encrasicolus]|uniref:uroplakin-2 n=1 Tax=Engraulis encrasicolus TaxID=184585 RepID=UPI002FD34EB3
MLTTLLVFAGALLTLASADFTASILEEHVVSGELPDSLLLTLPPCEMAGKSVNLTYKINSTNDENTLVDIFTVPACDDNETKEGASLVSRNVGYKVSNLQTGAHYILQYHVDGQKSNEVMASTRAAMNYEDIDTGLPARSGAMVVITVILSVAMFILMIGITVTLVVSNDDD